MAQRPANQTREGFVSASDPSSWRPLLLCYAAARFRGHTSVRVPIKERVYIEQQNAECVNGMEQDKHSF